MISVCLCFYKLKTIERLAVIRTISIVHCITVYTLRQTITSLELAEWVKLFAYTSNIVFTQRSIYFGIEIKFEKKRVLSSFTCFRLLGARKLFLPQAPQNVNSSLFHRPFLKFSYPKVKSMVFLFNRLFEKKTNK